MVCCPPHPWPHLWRKHDAPTHLWIPPGAPIGYCQQLTDAWEGDTSISLGDRREKGREREGKRGKGGGEMGGDGADTLRAVVPGVHRARGPQKTGMCSGIREPVETSGCVISRTLFPRNAYIEALTPRVAYLEMGSLRGSSRLKEAITWGPDQIRLESSESRRRRGTGNWGMVANDGTTCLQTPVCWCLDLGRVAPRTLSECGSVCKPNSLGCFAQAAGQTRAGDLGRSRRRVRGEVGGVAGRGLKPGVVGLL